jgi:hypothetical protein
MEKKDKLKIMTSTFDIVTFISKLHVQLKEKLTEKENHDITVFVSSWQAYVAEILKMSSDEVIDSYKMSPSYNEKTYKTAQFMIEHDISSTSKTIEA